MTHYPRCAAAWLVAAGLLRPALASAKGSEACRVVDDVAADAVSPAWRRAIDSLRREMLAASTTRCDGIELVLTRDGANLRVTAKAKDGRATSRRVETPGGLSAVAFGLLAVAPRDELPQTEDRHEVPPPPEPPTPVPLAPRPAWGLSVSASTGIRVGLPSDVLVADVDARADLLVHDWLLTFNIRAAPLVLAVRGAYDDDAYDETAVGLALGRQLRRGRSVIALTGGASFAYVWVESDALNLSAERAQLRLVATARWGYPIAPSLRLNATLDGEFAPAALFDTPAAAGLPAFPTVTLGLRLGAEMLL